MTTESTAVAVTGAVQNDNPLTQINTLPLVEAAVLYGKQGLRVFPLEPGTKLPMNSWSWTHMNTSDEDVIRQWWSIYPNANIAIICGEVSGINVLDIDVKKGQNGDASYRAITQELFHGPMARTPTGGSHLLFQYRPGFTNFTKRGEQGGLDMRTNNGYVAAAPSVTADGVYRWEQGGSVPVMPDVLQVTCEGWSRASDTVTVDAPEIPESLVDWRTLDLKDRHVDYLDVGDTSPWNNDENPAVYSVAGAIQQRLQDVGQVYGVMCANPHVWAFAERHSTHGDPAGWLWKYGISGMVMAATKTLSADVFAVVAPVDAAPDAPAGPTEFKKILSVQNALRHHLAPQAYLIDGVMPDTAIGIFFGASQHLKTFVVLDMVLSVAMDTSYHGHDIDRSGWCMYVAGEGVGGIPRRINAWRLEHGFSIDELADRFFYTTAALNMLDPAQVQGLMSAIDTIVTERGQGAPTAIVFDTFVRNIIGDENSAEVITVFSGHAAELRDKYQCVVAAVDHTGWSVSDRVKGSQTKHGNADFVIQTVRGEKAGEFTDDLQVIFHKFKDEEEPAPMDFKAKPVPFAVPDKHGEMVDTSSLVLVKASIEEVQAKKAKKGKALGGRKKIANDALGEAIERYGRPATDDEVAASPETLSMGEMVVAVEDWRSVVYARGIVEADADQETRRKAWNRARVDLINGGYAAVYEDAAWPVCALADANLGGTKKVKLAGSDFDQVGGTNSLFDGTPTIGPTH